MQLTPGDRRFAAHSDVEIVVVRPPGGDATLACGGVEMLDEPGENGDGDAGDGTTQLGKRYSDEESGLEVLCSSGGDGELSVDGREMQQLAARELPASD